MYQVKYIKVLLMLIFYTLDLLCVVFRSVMDTTAVSLGSRRVTEEYFVFGVSSLD